MATVKISQLPNNATTTGEEELPIVQDGVTKKVTIKNLLPNFSFTNIGGSLIDYSTITKGKKTLTANTELSITNIVEGQAGLLLITQDSTGSLTLTIANKVIQLNTAPNSSTLVGFICTGVGQFEFDSNKGQTSPSLDIGWTNVVFGSTNGLVVNGDFLTSSVNNGWYAQGWNAHTFAAGQDFLVIQEIRDATCVNALIGCHTSDVNYNHNPPAIDYGVETADATLFGWAAFYGGSYSATPPYTPVPASLPYWIGLRRLSGVLEYVISEDKTTWNTVFAFATNNNNALYITGNVYDFGIGKMCKPQYKNL